MMKKRMSLLILVLPLMFLPMQTHAGATPVDDPPLFPRISGYTPFSMEESKTGVYRFYDGNRLVGVAGKMTRLWYEAPDDLAPIAPEMILHDYANLLKKSRGVLLFNNRYAGYPDARSKRTVLTGKLLSDGVEIWVEVSPNGSGSSYAVTLVETGAAYMATAEEQAGLSSRNMAAKDKIPKPARQITTADSGGLDVARPVAGVKKDFGPAFKPKLRDPADMTDPNAPTQQRYVVVKGDNLWTISGKPDVYADNMQWPLIFKVNRDQIQDPDIIEIGQNFAISREFKQEEVEQAIANAKLTPRYIKHTKPRKRLPIEY